MNGNKELVKEWLRKAGHDIGLAKLALDNKTEFTDLICFHAQQAIEKYLKAYLIFLDVEILKTHSLVYLLDLIAEKDNSFRPLYEKVEELEGYAVEVRYPDDTFDPTVQDAENAYQNCLEIKRFIDEKLYDFMK